MGRRSRELPTTLGRIRNRLEHTNSPKPEINPSGFARPTKYLPMPIQRARAARASCLPLKRRAVSRSSLATEFSAVRNSTRAFLWRATRQHPRGPFLGAPSTKQEEVKQTWAVFSAVCCRSWATFSPVSSAFWSTRCSDTNAWFAARPPTSQISRSGVGPQTIHYAEPIQR